ncbi:unnamed protein product [Trifolium pratense]|uniref:Uncharacterized protein n=1 Tax=Trifolium pratense TaxID=57577 RepID=A0ACB0L1R3_TRIPR|nr:unnamed protein product [Trifolium pratense]
MSRACDYIKDIRDKKEVWKLAVKIDDIWTNTKASKEYAELMKLKTFTISNFRVQHNDDKFKLTPHTFKLQFISGTLVKPNEMPNMPVSFFKFKKFEDIKAMNFREDYLGTDSSSKSNGLVEAKSDIVVKVGLRKGSNSFAEAAGFSEERF